MRKILMLAAAIGALSFSAAHANTVTDPVGDFASNYTGSHDADLDVVSFSVDYNALTSSFTLAGVMAGTINTAGTDSYVIGVDTGAGAHHPFTAQGAPNVRFDQTISVLQSGLTTIAGHPNLTATISGDSFSVVVPLADLPSTGASAPLYAFNLWPENASRSISDFAPNNADLVAAAPEPGAWALMLVGVGAMGFAMRRGRRLQPQMNLS